MFLAELKRRILPVLYRISFPDIQIKHHWTKNKLVLHPIRHKDYWFHGRKREIDSIKLFQALIGEGDYVLEIGGHIGYVTIFISDLVGASGCVDVFEPGANNLVYAKKNLERLSNVRLECKCVADYTGTTKFYVENLTGQNNSLLVDFPLLDGNIYRSGVRNIKRQEVEVPCITVDEYLKLKRDPSFVKIDVEGAELRVLKGMQKLLTNGTSALMVEVMDMQNREEIYSILIDAGYKIFNQKSEELRSPVQLAGNIFCVKCLDDRMRVFCS